MISNYPLTTIDSILASFNGCKFFSTIDLRSGHYHTRCTKEAAEKTAFITNKGKWIFHSLPFGINIGPTAFSYVLDKVLAPCTEYALNYLDNIILFLTTWQEHLEHLEEVFRWLEAVDLTIKCNKCKFFKTKVHYLGFLVGIDDVQPLPEMVTAIEALEPPKDINELRQFLGLVGLYRKFIPTLCRCHRMPEQVRISRFSPEQNSGCSCRQAFIHYCELHQVWGRTKKLQLI